MTGQVVRRRDHWSRMLVRLMEHRLPRWADHVTAISGFLADLAYARGSGSDLVAQRVLAGQCCGQGRDPSKAGVTNRYFLQRFHGPDDG